MDRKENPADGPLDCTTCRDQMQEYLDGTLDKTAGLSVFLHMRDCADCQSEHDRLVGLFQLLDGLPDHEPPANFDEKILAGINHDGYKAMAGIRRERVPVFLEEESLPAFVRSGATRGAGLVVTMGAVAAQYFLHAPVVQSVQSVQSVQNVQIVQIALSALAVAGVVPELLVRVQRVARKMVLAQERAKDTGS